MHSTQLLLLPVEARRLDGGLPGVAELFLPAGVDLVSVLLEGQECAFYLLVRLRVLDDSVREAHVAVGACLPQLPRLFALAARDRTLLRPVLVPEGAASPSGSRSSGPGSRRTPAGGARSCHPR